ncbi:MAG: phosphoribosylformylglycinamidine synthase subunit PurS [Verrucomicrobiales bacterium]
MISCLGMSVVRVKIMPKQGLLDPQGQAVKKALHELGSSDIKDVRVGRLVEITSADGLDAAKLDELCQRLLANPVVEDYEILS